MSQETEETSNFNELGIGVEVAHEETIATDYSVDTGIDHTQSQSETAAEASSSSTSTRPRRNARKSVLYNNDDYELQLPGVPKEEDNQSVSLMTSELIPSSQKSFSKRARVGDEPLRGSKKRKTLPRLEESSISSQRLQPNMSPRQQIYGSSSMHPLGAEQEIPYGREADDDGPPILNMASSRYPDDRIHMGTDEIDDMGSFADEEDDYLDGEPPSLELNPPSKRRGRPRKGDDLGLEDGEKTTDRIGDVDNKKEKKQKQSNPTQMVPRSSFRVQGERVISKALADRQYHVKLFEDEVDITENGDCYATVISGCLAYLLRKERIIELLTNDGEVAMIREGGWMLDKPPRLPPLVQHKACFAFYVDGSKIMSIKDVTNDDLKPWSSSGEHYNDPVIKPNVRRHPVARLNGRLQPIKGDPRLAELHLTEYSAWLPRLLRLRKKVFYLSRDGQIYGNVLILYDYTCPGEAPSVVNLPHGNDYLRSAMMETTSDPHMLDLDDSTPFEDEIVEGSRGGTYLRVKPNKLGWAHNKKLLLKYLVNEPNLLDQSNCLNRRTPLLPPLISSVGVFVYFVPSNFVANQIHHTGDGLSPWTVNVQPGSGESPSPRVRSTRRALEQDESGLFVTAKEGTPWQQTQLCLVETMSVLARCPRLRKRVIYVQRNNSIILGNVCYIYEYVRDGPIPAAYVKGSTPVGTPTAASKRQMNQWMEDKKSLEDNSQGPSTSSAIQASGDNNGVEEDQFIDVEDLEVVEEEVIGHDSMQEEEIDHQQVQMLQQEPIQEQILDEELLDMSQEDVLNNGYDVEFDDDPLTQQENSAPYFETPRQLDTGHIYLTVRHKRVASGFDTVLEWIANTNVVEERGLLNYAKPGHPPIVRNARAYAFFVSGNSIFPHDINRDDFSPWSHNGNPQNPTCYRTKVRKVGVICDEIASQFQIKDVDYKTCPFHLVFLYSINPREPRLRKKIYYMMETESRLVVSHALIMYDYNLEGDLPRMHGGYLKRFAKRTTKRAPLQIHDVDNDVSDMSESEKECPFAVPSCMAEDGTMYLQLLDMDFWNDRNRQLHFLVNKPNLIESLGCLNNRVPTLPPATTNKAAFAFFVDGLEVDARNLTCDGLVPWSENNSTNPHGVTKRPKSAKQPLALNRDNQLRVWKTPAHRGEIIEFQLHVYTATLPRCPRLRKKVTYVLKNGHQIGHAMILYWYTEPGEMPTPINMNVLSQEYTLQRLPPHIREDVHTLLSRMSPPEVSKIILEKYGVSVNTKMLYYIRRREIMTVTSGGEPHQQDLYDSKNEMIEASGYVDDWTTPVDPSAPSTSGGHGRGRKPKILHEVLDDRDLQVSHTEEIEQQPQRDYGTGRKALEDVHQHPHHHHPLHQHHPLHTPDPKNFLAPRPITTTPGMIRGSHRSEAIWRIARNSFGTTTDTEIFDIIFKMLFDKNEQRLLQIVNQTFGVEILQGEEVMDNGDMIHMGNVGEIVEEIVEEEVVQTAEEAARQGGPMNEEKVYMGDKDLSDGMEQIVEEEVTDQLLEEAIVEGVLVEEELNPNAVIIDDHHMRA
ncbi:hypothetical protein GCK72_000824 [Caenorhabditis remanei]|uniref:DUF7747 domain-containing protein n=1 Tax=Caenorhabditis remanei TaxID=31234 RepID=A0A6A5HP60_CAERE|nr:hypothetical protein GCK72_000824 [Caenorhabditis remanei]KAF1769011.1 hypothetical protein GCK72_000824 [Caenorhabditis remanei]